MSDQDVEALPNRARRRLDSMISTRFGPDEIAAIRAVVGDGSLSKFIRDASCRAAGMSRCDAKGHWATVTEHVTVTNGSVQFGGPMSSGLNSTSCPTFSGRICQACSMERLGCWISLPNGIAHTHAA